MKSLIASIFALIGLLVAGPLAHADTLPTAGAKTAIIALNGEIDDYSRDGLIRRFDRAKEAGAQVVILDIDSPGGLVTSSLEISLYLKRQDSVHTIAYVRNKALSGAAMVSMACNEIWMSPSSTIGDCAPIIFNNTGGLEALPAAERAKQESPVVRDFEDSAARNGYSPVVARAMVSVERSVYFLQNSAGEKKVVDEPEYKKLTADGSDWKPVPGFDNPIDGPTSLLTLYPKAAVALGLAKGTANSANDVALKQGYSVVIDLTPGWGERLIEILNGAAVRGLLLTIFLTCLYIALNAPGHGAAEAVAVVSLGILIGVPLLTGYANWWEVAAILVGLGLVAFEIFVFPGHFVSLITGGVLILGGLVLTFAGKEPSSPGWLPSMESTWAGIQHGLIAVVSSVIAWVFLSAWLRRFLPGIPYFNKLILTATSGNVAAIPAGRANADVWPFVGTIGVATTELLPGGYAEFPFGDSTRPAAVINIDGYGATGTKVVVQQIDGSSVRVRAFKA
jgi:membrane-bound serine protease (ClpP class)